MKREIKFRAWNEEDNRWASGLDFKREGLFINYNISDNGEFELQADYPMRGYGRFILMQYTGLKDKNDKEIYEGDIVKVPAGWGDGLLYNSFIGEIQYDAPNFYVNQGININKTGKWSNQEYKWEEIEIIGNIYENPELLKS